jgi:hypothetical protein
LDLQDTQIGLPLLEPIQRIMIGAEILRQPVSFIRRTVSIGNFDC